MAYRDIEKRRAGDRTRAARRRAERLAAGLCPRCGKRPPAEGRAECEPCRDRCNATSRARDARLRAEGKPRRDRRKARAYERKRSKRERAERIAAGVCTSCGKVPAAPDSLRCEPCGDKRREADRQEYAEAKAAGKMYGGKSIAGKRADGRRHVRKRRVKRLEAGLCTLCGKCPPRPGRKTCQPCAEKRQARERERMAERIARGQCVRCPRTALPGRTSCERHSNRNSDSDRKNERSRERYRERRRAMRCTSCGAPSGGASRCEPCAARSYSGLLHRQARDGYDPGAGYAGHDGSEAHSLAEARDGCAE